MTFSQGAEALFGTLDENLRFLETTFEVRLSLAENNLIIEGSDAQVGIIERLIADYDQFRREGVPFSNNDLKSVIRLISEDSSLRLRDCLPSGKSRICGRKAVTPRSLNQRRYLDAIEKGDMTKSSSSSGLARIISGLRKLSRNMTSPIALRFCSPRCSINSNRASLSIGSCRTISRSAFSSKCTTTSGSRRGAVSSPGQHF